METNYAFFKHPRSGDIYACRYDIDTQRIIEAAGPVHQRDAAFERIGDTPSRAESDAAYAILSNGADTEADGAWLDSEVWGVSSKP